ncbi:S-layer homology domain-containing protein [Paenibacillus sp. LHD-117]|uniref:S-layer homology domain-containing protein n=1 Tax=Paenibacillus sp. LHD-117 TaxID=3071412 RepID=UPI0027E20C4B|nr:S-layer homology domain-containing protein [Paenibacillus sp. LHD-117]MDQ6422568.1 S-layer homology domain-containing protein [Paenibacillus sp. LHD-117]
MIGRHKKRILPSFLAVSLMSTMFFGISTEKALAATSIQLDPGYMHKAWEGWGTSLAWFGNVTGGYEDAAREALADALYSDEGLNYNIVRYNIGGGENPEYDTMRQGGRMPGFAPNPADSEALAPSDFDWSQDANQRWWLEAAIERGADILEAFSNSAPYYMTVSGSTTGHRESWKDNLREDQYNNFANYLAEVVKHFQDEGIQFRSLSPVNEPSTNYWGFGGGQEGSHWDPASQAKMINAARGALNERGLQDVRISAMDESVIDTFVTNWNSYDEVTKANVGQMNTHTYGGWQRHLVRDQAKAAGKTLWMSEVDLGPSGVAHNHDDFEPALALAERIMTDITWLEPQAWVIWQAIESEVNMQPQKENMNWGLIHANFDNPEEWYLTKKYYAMAQFSKFIPQGSRFIGDDNDNTLAAYDDANGKIYVVYRNPETSAQSISLNLSQFDAVNGVATPYVSSAIENVVQKNGIPVAGKTLNATVGAKSITTFVIDGATYTTNTAIPQNEMSATATSEAPGEGPDKTLDGNASTKWHTAYDGSYTALPHSITYHLGQSYNGVYKLKYTPRQDVDFNGIVTKYEISVSSDGTTFTKAAEGTWDADKKEKTATFNAVGASYVKFTALASRSDAGKQYGSAAEINIYTRDGYTVDKTLLNGAIADATAFINEFEKDPSYLTVLQSLRNEAEALRDSSSATEEEIARMAGKLAAEMDAIVSGGNPIAGVDLFYAPEAYWGNPASHILDGDAGTFYETNWDENGRKYVPGDYIILDLNETKADVGLLTYTPRQDKANGRIARYNIYTSNEDLAGTTVDGTQNYLDAHFVLAGTGAWDTSKSGQQTATFKSKTARYIAIQAMTTGGDANTLAAAELSVKQKEVTNIDPSSVTAAIERINEIKTGLNPLVTASVDKLIADIGDVAMLTEESVAYYTVVLDDKYELYANLGQNESIKSGEVWLDTEGMPIQAHGGGILYNKANKTYYWYGEDKTENNVGSGYVPVTGIHAYSSKDLYNWKNEGVVLPVFNNPQLGEDVLPNGELPLYLDENSDTYKNSGVAFDPNRSITITNKDADYTKTMKSPVNSLSKHNSPERIAELNALYDGYTNERKQAMYKDFNWDKVVERPKVVYNETTGKYVMWWHQDGPIAGSYWTAEGGVAISDSPTGPFRFLGTFRLPNKGAENGNEGMLRDMTLYVDDDENPATHDKAYLVYASEENATTVIMMLNDEYTGPATNENGQTLEGEHYVRAFKGWREAPTIFKQDGVYYMITSGLTGWNPNPARYHVSTNGMFGPWWDNGDPMVGDWEGTTFRSQSTFVLPYRDGNGDLVPNKFIFMADRWFPNDLKDSRYVWLPIDLDTANRKVAVSWHDEWDMSVFKTGTTVTFNSNGGSDVRTVYGAAAGSKLAEPPAPSKDGYTFAGWFKDELFAEPWNYAADTVPASDFTLYAKWTQATTPTPDPGNPETPTPTPTTTPKPTSVTVSDKTGGKIEANGVTLEISADAIDSDIVVTVETIDRDDLDDKWRPQGAELVSEVFEMIKDKLGHFKDPVTITIKFNPDQVDMKKFNLFIAWLNEATNEWIKLDNIKVDPSKFTVTGTVDHFTKFAIIAETIDGGEQQTLLKDIAGHWAEQDIRNLVQLGAVNGYKDGTYRPSQNITRAEFINILVKAMGLKETAAQTGFKDIEGHWAEDAISIAVANGIVEGFEDHTFRPDVSITREQMAVMIVKAFKLELKMDGASFEDESEISAWAVPYVTAATQLGILTGYEDGTVKPKQLATRAHAAALMTRSLEQAAAE